MRAGSSRQPQTALDVAEGGGVQMTYKFLNTIVDDLGAFIIKAPTLYRLAVFRDDVIFLIYVYQRWIYHVDKSRVNEFGFSDRPPEETGTIEGASASTSGQGAVRSAEGPHAAAVAGASAATGARRKDAAKQVRLLLRMAAVCVHARQGHPAAHDDIVRTLTAWCTYVATVAFSCFVTGLHAFARATCFGRCGRAGSRCSHCLCRHTYG